ncbi:hypothetical protein PV392_04225 [Streptomyces sp. ME03-5709C]|nr:hypothetical protein [Streptomyces sp. ME03-5709C]
MSYDIYFVRRGDDQSWAAAPESPEFDDATFDEDAEVLVPAELLDAWDRIVPQARTLLGEVELFETGESYELSHGGTGIQLSICGDEVTITVPYWHSGENAVRVLGQVYALSVVVELETGLAAYDPQVEAPLSELSPEHGSAVMSTIADDLRRRGF